MKRNPIERMRIERRVAWAVFLTAALLMAGLYFLGGGAAP